MTYTNTKTRLSNVQSDISKIPQRLIFMKKIKHQPQHLSSSNNILAINHQQLYHQNQHFYKHKYFSSNTNILNIEHQQFPLNTSILNIKDEYSSSNTNNFHETPTFFIKHQQFPSNSFHQSPTGSNTNTYH